MRSRCASKSGFEQACSARRPQLHSAARDALRLRGASGSVRLVLLGDCATPCTAEVEVCCCVKAFARAASEGRCCGGSGYVVFWECGVAPRLCVRHAGLPEHENLGKTCQWDVCLQLTICHMIDDLA